MKPLYIFDLDGTLALTDHRQHFVADKKNQRWDEFSRACLDDLPNKALVQLYNSLWVNETDGWQNDVYIWSGRSDLVKAETVKWLDIHTITGAYDPLFYTYLKEDPYLKMRPHEDHVPDAHLKRDWWEKLPQEDKDRLVCVFDDSERMVTMWRSLGITCLQVAPGR